MPRGSARGRRLGTRPAAPRQQMALLLPLLMCALVVAYPYEQVPGSWQQASDYSRRTFTFATGLASAEVEAATKRVTWLREDGHITASATADWRKRGAVTAVKDQGLGLKTDDSSSSSDPRCRLNGNWTDVATNTTRIEIFQPPAFNYLNWRSSAYHGAFSEGRSDPVQHGTWSHSGWLLFYETQSKQTMKIGKSSLVADAPDCSWIEVANQSWCRFPYCGFPQPDHQPWPFPFPDPDHPAFLAPRWTPNWNLTESTTVAPSAPDYFTPDHPWGLVQLDWTNAAKYWHASPDNKNSNCSAVSLEGCRRLKSTRKAQRCFVYHNFELACEFLERQRAVMYDPAKSDWFMRYQNGSIWQVEAGYYHEDLGTTFAWNYSNPAAADYVIESTMADLMHPEIDGTYIDDGPYGFPLEKPTAVRDLGMSIAELSAYQEAAVGTYYRLMTRMIAAGKYSYQELGWYSGSAEITRSGCVQFMRSRCALSSQNHTLMMHARSAPGSSEVLNQTVAAFLIARSPISFIGFGWPSADNVWSDTFLLQPGEPVGLCVEERLGVFSRQWTKGTVELDCGKWEAKLPFNRV